MIAGTTFKNLNLQQEKLLHKSFDCLEEYKIVLKEYTFLKIIKLISTFKIDKTHKDTIILNFLYF